MGLTSTTTVPHTACVWLCASHRLLHLLSYLWQWWLKKSNEWTAADPEIEENLSNQTIITSGFLKCYQLALYRRNIHFNCILIVKKYEHLLSKLALACHGPYLGKHMKVIETCFLKLCRNINLRTESFLIQAWCYTITWFETTFWTLTLVQMWNKTKSNGISICMNS